MTTWHVVNNVVKFIVHEALLVVEPVELKVKVVIENDICII